MYLCISHQTGTIVMGYHPDFQKSSHMGRVGNQNFVSIPYGMLRKKLQYLCQMYGIHMILQEESYTSKASFFDGDEMPVYGKENGLTPEFNGRRVMRGLYETKDGYRLNADINGALNILRKSKVVCLTALYRRGVVDTPHRIRIA